MAKDVRNPEFWNKFMQRPEVQAAMRSKLKYESAAEAAQRTKLDKLERKQRRYEIMNELMKCATNVKHLISPMFRYKITQQYLWKVLCEARKEGLLFCDKLRQPQVYHRLQAIKAEITAGPYGVAGWQAEEEVEEDLMDKMVVEADCIPGGIDGEAPDRKQVLDRREIQGVLDFGQRIKSEGNEAFMNENWEGALTRYCQGDEMLKNFAAEPHLEKENKELKTMHRQCLNNKANAALMTDQWQTALRAADSALKLKMDDEKALFRKAQALEGLGRTEEALEVLNEVEEIAGDMDEEFKEQILDDVRERKEELKAIERKAAKDFNSMFKAMGDKQVFGSGRFLADGTSPPPALTGAEERKLKRIKEQEEYRTAKAKYELEQRRKDDPELAADIFRDVGFVLIPGAVSDQHCSELLAACQSEEAEILHRDPAGVGNRGHGRYSLGEAQSTGHLLHRAEWASLVDLEKVTPVLQRIFGKSGYVCAGAGGDFVLPNTYEYQPLHVDLDFPGCQQQSASPVVTLNVPLLPLTWENGPTRLIPGTHLPASWQPPPPALEPEAWKLFTFCPIAAGTAILRDNRAWHGGTPNLSQTSRFLPNVEFAAAWWCVGSTDELWRNPWKLAPRCMPRGIYERLSPFAKHVCRLVVTDDPSLKYGVREGKPIIDQPKEPEMPTPNRPPFGYRSADRTRTLTKAQAEQLLEVSAWKFWRANERLSLKWALLVS
ncbi:Peptidyl-prolyl cis-trans isomerase D [Symbiodinium microadriaticum]|uniref:Peptidyl-prolyl cis-trans isomerase D n=1 Tax=Symbiodinium microadriaticum TaxID=2951 RepID=A0A1Q9D709_SYMMI|nr:Peptidyl-prolyl cis-trans isomerase D [Symbiodinium microadriaticum]CAE6918647.1 Ppid [Symbiodinium sp. KB8]CAE7909183.1 Ppid [Symbiodinium microadriaticum]